MVTMGLSIPVDTRLFVSVAYDGILESLYQHVLEARLVSQQIRNDGTVGVTAYKRRIFIVGPLLCLVAQDDGCNLDFTPPLYF